MKKGVIVLFLLVILLVSPLALAQDQTYSGFNRFTDDVRLFFSGGDNKVMLALEIREKEIDSAIENVQNEKIEKADENLEGAYKKIQIVQKKVSMNTAEEVKASSNRIREKIMNQENLPKDFDVYVLEEEKTELTAEWVIEVDGKEGQTLSNEVEIVMGENGEQNRIVEIEKRMGEIDMEIKEWVLDTFEKTVETDEGLTWEVANKIVKEDGNDGLTREIKTYMDVVKDNVVDKPPMHKDNGGITPTPNVVDDGPCKEGEENCNNDIAPGPQGIVGVFVPEPRDEGPPLDSETSSDADGDDNIGSVEGTNDVAPTVDSNEGDSSESVSSDSGDSSSSESLSSDDDSISITGEIIKDSNSNNFIKKLFSWLF